MSFRILCPNGHELLAELEYVGRMIRCPACQLVMIVPDPRPPAPAQPPPLPEVAPAPPPVVQITAEPPPPPRLVPQEVVVVVQPTRPPPAPPVSEEAVEVVEPEATEEEEYPRKRKGLTTDERMGRVLLGLGLHYAKLMCFLGAMIVMVGSDLLLRFAVAGAAAGAAVQGRQGAASGGSDAVILTILLILGIVLLLTMLVTPILGFVGSLLCLWVPKKTGAARPLIMVSFGLDSGALGLMLLSAILNFTAVGNRGVVAVGLVGVAGIMALTAVLLAFAAWILFMLFLRGLAYYLEDEVTGDEAMTLMGLLIVAGPGILVLFIVLSFLLASIPEVARFVLGGASVMWAVLMINLLFRALALVSTIRQHLATRY